MEREASDQADERTDGRWGGLRRESRRHPRRVASHRSSYPVAVMDTSKEEWAALDTRYRRETQLIMGSFFLSFAVLGSIGNAVTIFVIIRTRRLYNPCTPFLVNISVADLSTTLFILPILGFNALAGFYLIPFPVCKFFSVSFHTGIVTSWTALAVLSGVRCLGIWFSNGELSRLWTLALIAFSWLIPNTLLAVLIYANWARRGHAPELCAFFCGRKHLEPWNYGNNSTGCVGESSDIGRARECKHDLDLDREDSPVIPTALLAISGAPFLATSVFYAFIWIKMKDSKRLLQSLEIAAFNKHIREEKFTRMMALIFGSMTICNVIPLIIFVTVSVNHARQSDMDYFNDSLEVIPIIHNVTLFIPSVSNPIIYVLSNPNYRRAYKAMLCPRRLQNEECPASTRLQEFCN